MALIPETTHAPLSLYAIAAGARDMTVWLYQLLEEKFDPKELSLSDLTRKADTVDDSFIVTCGNGRRFVVAVREMTNPQVLYRMLVDGKEHWAPLHQAGVVYDNDYVNVEIGGRVREIDGRERNITDEEKRQIRDLADAHSASR